MGVNIFKTHLSLALCATLGVLGAADIKLTLKKDGASTPDGYPVQFKYSYTQDGSGQSASSPPGPPSGKELTIDTDYFWSDSTGNTLSLKKPANTDVATAIFKAPGNDDNLLLENFNYISVGDDLTTKGQDSTYFAILNGPTSFTSFTLNGANIYSGSNLFIGPLSSDTTSSSTKNITGGFATVYLKGSISVDANAIDQADTKGSGKADASITFRSEYDGALYNITSDSSLNLTSTTGDKKSSVSFEVGVTKDSKLAQNQSVLNQGSINITNTTANTTLGTVSKEKNTISFNGVNLQNEGKINLINSTLSFKDADLIISDSESAQAGSISILAQSQEKSKLSSNSGVNNKSTIFYENTGSIAKAFEIASQNITIAGAKPSDGTDSELFGAQLTIGVKASASNPPDQANTLLLTGTKDAAMSIVIGADSGNDKHTSLVFGASSNPIKDLDIGNHVSITVQSGAKLDLTQGVTGNRIITLKPKGGAKAAPPVAPNPADVLDFFNHGSITLKANTTKNSTDYTTLDASGKKIVLTEYAETKTTCVIGGSGECGNINDANSIPKNATLKTETLKDAGSLNITGGRSQIKAEVAYNFGDLNISSGGILDLSQITKAQDGTTSMTNVQSSDASNAIASNNAIGFVNAGVLTSSGGVIDTRTKFDKDWYNNKDGTSTTSSAGSSTNAKNLIITEALKAKVSDDMGNSGIKKDSNGGYLAEGSIWAENKANEKRAEFVAASGMTTIRASGVQNLGLTTVAKDAVLNLACVGTDYCYNGGYWSDAKDGIVPAPNLTSSGAGSSDADRFKATNIKWDNKTNGSGGGELRLNGGTLSVLDSYKYQDSAKKDKTEIIHHSLTINGGTLSAYGGGASYIYTGIGGDAATKSMGTSDKYLTLNGGNLALMGDSRLLVISQVSSSSVKSASADADFTWKIPSSASSSSGGEFRMYIGDDDYKSNSRGLYVLRSTDKGIEAGVIRFENAANGGVGAASQTTNKPTFVIDLSNLSGKNTILLDKQYNFMVAGSIEKNNGSSSTKISADDFTMKLYFGKGADTTSGIDKPASSDKDYGTKDDALCKNDPKFCLNASDTKNENGSSSVSNGEITIGGNGSGKDEGVVVVDTSTPIDSISGTTNWPSNGGTKKHPYADFVTFNKIYQEGSGNCNILGDLSGCALIGFSAVKSQTLKENGITAVFESIKERASQLSGTDNSVVKNSASGIDKIEHINENAMAILQGVVDTNGAASSSVLLRLQKLQYTGDLSEANSVASDIDSIDHIFSMVSDSAAAGLELTNRVHFSSTLSTNIRLAQRSNPYNDSFASAIASLKGKRFADASGNYFSYTDRFDYDHNVWGQLIGGVGGFYSGGYSALGGFSVGYDKLFSRVLLGGYATYAYAHSALNSYKGDSNAKSSKNSNNLELGGYLRVYADAHEVDVVLSETFGFNGLHIKGNNLINQKVDFNNFTTNVAARYGYILPINPVEGFYIKPLVDLNMLYQYNTQANGSGETAIIKEGQHATQLNLGAFVEFRKYTDEKKFFYVMPGIQQDIFVYNSNGQIYFAQSALNKITYNVDNNYRTYLTVMGGGEIGIRQDLSITFGIGAKFSWDRYFLNANVGVKYMFNTN